MRGWIVSSAIALLFWGLWAFFPRLAVGYIKPTSLTVYQTIGSVIVMLGILIFAGGKIEYHTLGSFYGVLSGACGILGFLFYSMALKQGNPAVVAAITALYPLVAIVLFFFLLKEGITIKQGLGIASAVLAVVLLSS